MIRRPDIYTVHRNGSLGVWVEGPLPVSDMVALTAAWIEKGFDIIDSAIAQKLGASLVVTNHAGSVAWRKELGLDQPKGPDTNG